MVLCYCHKLWLGLEVVINIADWNLIIFSFGENLLNHTRWREQVQMIPLAPICDHLVCFPNCDHGIYCRCHLVWVWSKPVLNSGLYYPSRNRTKTGSLAMVETVTLACNRVKVAYTFNCGQHLPHISLSPMVPIQRIGLRIRVTRHDSD